MKVAVIGGGVAGLVVAREVARDGHDVVLLEASDTTGGRVRTAYDASGGVSYEKGPWRIPSHHTRTCLLFESYEVHLRPGTSRPVPDGGDKETTAALPGLTTWQIRALAASPADADARDLATGYAGQTHSASGATPYEVDGGGLHVAPLGFSEMVRRLTADVERVATVRRSSRVADLRRGAGGEGYTLDVSERTGHNAFGRHTLAAEAVFLCVPPREWRSWTCLAANARALAAAVETGVLHHIYVKTTPCLPGGVHRHDPHLGQVVSSQYSSGGGPDGPPCWWQVSYSSGRVAELWHDYALARPQGFWERMRRHVARLLPGGQLHELRRHHWPFAYHKWRAVVGFDLPSAVAKAVMPNPYRLPSLYCAGEAFSSHQAWIEGALETAELAVRAFRWGDGVPSEAEKEGAGRDCLMVEGRRVDVTDFKRVHPGSEAALLHHLGEEVDVLLVHIGHSDKAWATVFSLAM